MRVFVSRIIMSALAAVAAAPAAAQAPARMMGAPYHDASRAFIDLMIPHHEMAIMMSEHAMPMMKNDSVKQLARRMIAVQRDEITQLKATRRALFGSDSTRDPMMRAMMQAMGMHAMGMQAMRDTGMSRMMMDSMHMQHHPDSAMQHHPDSATQQHPAMPRAGMAMPQGMHTMSGDIDHMFLEHMISHHQDGIDMSILAEDSQAATRVKELARRIREGQERDIATMRSLLASLPATPATP